MFLFLAKTVVLLPWHTLMFFPFSCVLSAAEQQIPLCLTSSFLRLRLVFFLSIPKYLFDFSKALHLYLLMKYWQANSSKCHNTVWLSEWPFWNLSPSVSRSHSSSHALRGSQWRQHVSIQETRVAPSQEVYLFSAIPCALGLTMFSETSVQVAPFSHSSLKTR